MAHQAKLGRTTMAVLSATLLATCCSFASIPLPEHPRPDWERSDWINLNGVWDFAFAADGQEPKSFDLKITVPFGWGSPLSGVSDAGDTGFYRRSVTVPAEWKGRRVFLVVGASDHDTECWLDGVKVGSHSGGYTPFEFEITDCVGWGCPQELKMRVWDMPAKDAKEDWRLFGKQGYGNVRGIWQTVYLEARGDQYVDSLRFLPDIGSGAVTAEVKLDTPAKRPLELEFAFRKEDRARPATVAFAPGQMSARLKIPLDGVRLWDMENPYLYEVSVSLGAKEGGDVLDRVSTYFGMREVSVAKLPGTGIPYVALNGKPIYLRLALDQSYHPGGYYTFPTDEFMKNEIMISKKLALSGNRVHIKVEVPRKLYWADKLGLLIMADVPCAWGRASEAMFREHWFCFEDMVRRDFNHPSIFSWVLFNETWGLFASGNHWPEYDRRRRYAPWVRSRVAEAYAKAKSLDPTRLVEDNSPCNRDHVVTDINTWHSYAPGYRWDDIVQDWCDKTFPGSGCNYVGGHVQGDVPMFNSECGNVWGYKGSAGDCDFTWDYHMMMNAFRRRLKCAGWLYTEHHDVINEWNGYVRFDRTWKETGLGDLFPGMSLADFHGDAYLPLDRELCREFRPGETYVLPVDVSLTTDAYAGRKLTLESALHWVDDSGREHDAPAAEAVTFTASAWQGGRVADLAVKLPAERSVGVVRVALKDGGKVVSRNFTCFFVDASPSAGRVSVSPCAFSRASWSQKQWNVMDGLKVCGAGRGFFEYTFPVAADAVGKGAVFRAEIGAKRLYTKDLETGGNDANEQDFVRGGGYSKRSRSPNSYPQTSVDKWPGEVVVYANGERVSSARLPDDPADHRGILSWFGQKRDNTLSEAGSYGWLVEAEIPASVMEKAKDGKLVVRLETSEHGLAVYGGRFGRYPFDPHVEFGRQDGSLKH